MMSRLVMAYRARRWLRWTIDAAVVLLLVGVVAAVHTVFFNGWPLHDPFRFLPYLWH